MTIEYIFSVLTQFEAKNEWLILICILLETNHVTAHLAKWLRPLHNTTTMAVSTQPVCKLRNWNEHTILRSRRPTSSVIDTNNWAIIGRYGRTNRRLDISISGATTRREGTSSLRAQIYFICETTGWSASPWAPRGRMTATLLPVPSAGCSGKSR